MYSLPLTFRYIREPDLQLALCRLLTLVQSLLLGHFRNMIMRVFLLDKPVDIRYNEIIFMSMDKRNRGQIALSQE